VKESISGLALRFAVSPAIRANFEHDYSAIRLAERAATGDANRRI
jgi:hypothetical protein